MLSPNVEFSVVEKASQARSDRPEPRAGAIIADRYQVDRLIARGGMAAVYKAHHVKLNRPIALKILSPPADAEDPESFVQRFRLEAETLAQLDHPNIVILHDFGETADGRFFLAMEYVEGPRLSDILKDGPLPYERSVKLILQVCAGLRYSHKRGVVHRDLKPSNLLIRLKEGADDQKAEEQVKVVDFGLVKLTETEAEQSITRAGLILGSPHCMAPEQIRGLDVDPRTDIYAIGVLLFRCITGQYPFHGPNSAATMIAHLNQPCPTFFQTAPEVQVPGGLEEIVRKCLEKKPEDRYPDMQALTNDLAAIIHVSPEAYKSVSQTTSTIQRALAAAPPEAEPRRSNMVPALLIATFALAALLLLSAAGLGIVAMGLGSGTSTAMVPPIEKPDEALGSTPLAPLTAKPVDVVSPEPVAVAAPVVAPVEKPVEKPIAKRPPVKKPPIVKPPEKPAGTADTKPDDTKSTPAGYQGLPDDFK
jgi:serine/threonine protein kinase